MYWNSENNCEEIEFLLNKQDLTLTELLDSENILQECKAQNKNLVQYILKPDTIDELIHLIVTEPPITIEEPLRFKYSNIACEILTSYIPKLKERIVTKINTLDKLYNFLEQDPPLNPLLTSFFTKTFGMLFAKANEEDWFSYQCICIHVIDFIKSKYGFLNTIYKHIGTPVVMDLLFSIISNVQGDEIRSDLFQWFNQQQLIPNLIKLLGQDNQSNKHSNVAQFISDLIKTGRTNRQNELQQLSTVENSINCDSLLKLLEDVTIMELLLNIMMENNQKDSCIESGIIIILTLLENPITNEPVSDKALQRLIDVEREHHQRIVENILKTIVPKIKDFHLLLINPPAKPDILTSITLLSPPFGNIRLQICTLLTVLIETGNPGIINAICETEFFNTLLKLFKQYCWNNILHNQVKRCCRYACLSFDDIEGGLIPSVLQTHIIVDCKIVPKLIECWMYNNEIQFENKRPRLGYMGHLIEIFDLLLSSAISSDKYRALIESNLSEDELKNWQMLTDLNDGEIIKEIKIQQQYLANLDPADNTESFDANINNFPEEAYTDNIESMHNTIDDDSNDYSAESFEEACNDRNSSTFNMDIEPCNLRAEIWEDPNMQQFMKKVVEDVDCVIREGAKKIQDISEFFGFNGIHCQQSQTNLVHNLKRYVVKVFEEEFQMKENETVLIHNNNNNNNDDDGDHNNADDDNRRKTTSPTSPVGININISENLYKKASVKLLTMSKFNFINSKGFIHQTDPIEKSLGIPDDTDNILDLIGIYSENIKAKIREEIKNKMICLKIDGVGSVKCDKSILVINAQFLCGKLIIVRTLGMIELTKGHTDDNFKNEIVNILNEYNISLEQIYSTVTDNGSNVLEPIELIQNEIDLLSEKHEVWRQNSTIFEMYTIGERLLEPTLKSIRCASNSLELVVNDVLKTDDLCVHIEEARLFVKKLRDQPYSFRFLVAEKKLLFLDIATRWISTYEMIDRIILDKTFIENLIKNDYNFNLSTQFWTTLEEFKTAFYPTFVATKQLQVEHLTMGEFFKMWLECELELKSMINNRYSKLLLNAMKNRKVKLFKSDEFVAAIYMDGRFNYDGSEYFTDVLKANAKTHLINTWRTMQAVAKQSSTLCVPTSSSPQPRQSSPSSQSRQSSSSLQPRQSSPSPQPRQSSPSPPPPPPPPTSSKLEKFLRQKEIYGNQLRCGGNDISLNFENKIDMLCHCNRLNADYDILEYWENKKYTDPELYSLAQIVFGVPSSQLSVKVAYNALTLVLTHSRTPLNGKMPYKNPWENTDINTTQTTTFNDFASDNFADFDLHFDAFNNPSNDDNNVSSLIVNNNISQQNDINNLESSTQSADILNDTFHNMSSFNNNDNNVMFINNNNNNNNRNNSYNYNNYSNYNNYNNYSNYNINFNLNNNSDNNINIANDDDVFDIEKKIDMLNLDCSTDDFFKNDDILNDSSNSDTKLHGDKSNSNSNSNSSSSSSSNNSSNDDGGNVSTSMEIESIDKSVVVSAPNNNHDSSNNNNDEIDDDMNDNNKNINVYKISNVQNDGDGNDKDNIITNNDADTIKTTNDQSTSEAVIVVPVIPKEAQISNGPVNDIDTTTVEDKNNAMNPIIEDGISKLSTDCKTSVIINNINEISTTTIQQQQQQQQQQQEQPSVPEISLASTTTDAVTVVHDTNETQHENGPI